MKLFSSAVVSISAKCSLVVGIVVSLCFSSGINIACAQDRPTLFIVGDSTVKNGTKGQRGWGEELAEHFDLQKIKVDNHAIGGRSSRTFQTEGRWDRVLQAAQAGDFVLIQMGHNDGGSLDDPKRARGTLPGIGEETREIDNPITQKHETVHTYGWYLRKYLADARAKSMTPILVTPIPHVPKEKLAEPQHEKSRHVQYCLEVAAAERCLLIDLNLLVMTKYMGLEPAEIKSKYFSEADNTHTSPDGAKLNAACVADGIRKLESCELKQFLK